MAGYTRQGPWHDNAAPDVLAVNLDAIESGVLDAATHHKRGTLAAMPAATAANRNWIYWAYDTGERFVSDGAVWQPLPVGTNALIDKSVTTAKLADKAVGAGQLADAVTGLLPTDAGQKGALVGRGGRSAIANWFTPAAANPYLLDSAIATRQGDIGAAGSSTFFEQGLWLVQSVYGFNASDVTTRTSLVHMSTSSGGEGLKFVGILATVGYTRNVTTTHAAENSDTVNGLLRVTTSAGNTRTFYNRLQAVPNVW